MYERPDVPKGGRHANAIAAVVLVVIAVALFVLVSALWRLANDDSKLGDASLGDAVSAAATVAAAPTEGYVATGDDVTSVLFVLLPDDGTDTSLAGLRLVSLDATASRATLVDIPPETVLSAETGATAASTYAAGDGDGASGLVSAVASAGGVGVAHVVVMRAAGWDELMGAAGSGASALASAGREALDSIVRSDMAAQDLLSLAKDVSGAGLSSAEAANVPLTESGTIDATALGVLVGTLSAAQG